MDVALLSLHREHPEWHPREGKPLLDGAEIHVPPPLVGRWVHRVLDAAVAAGTHVEPLAHAIATRRLDPLRLVNAGLYHNGDRLEKLARMVNDDGVKAFAPLMAMPMLHACRRAWSPRVPSDWAHGFCPVCGAWPAFAEARGLYGPRHLRCGRCGGDWQIESMRCPFCDE